MRDVAVPVRERDQDGCNRERDQCELPLEDEQDDGHEHDRQGVLEEEDQSVAEEETHALQVDGRARHQLARLVPVVEAEREPDEVRVEVAAQVHLHGERLAAGDHPAAVHQDRSEQPQRDDRADVDPELLSVVGRKRVVDDVLRHPDERDLTALVADGEQRRDDQRQLVGLQEPEQAKKRAPIRNRGH